MTAVSAESGTSVRTIFGSSFSAIASSERRMPLGLGCLEGAGGAQHPILRVKRVDDLQPDRQAGARQAARDRGGGLARHVEGITERRPIEPLFFVRRIVQIPADRQ